MKTLAAVGIALASLALSAAAQLPPPAPVGPGSVKLGRVAPTTPTTPEFQITGGATKRYTLGKWLEVEVPYETKPQMIDELSFHFVLLISNKLVDGNVTYVNIPAARDHYAVMYISPRTLQVLTGKPQATGSDVQNIWIEVSHQGQVLDRAAIQNRAIPQLPLLSGMVLNKNETPFAPLYWDRYEAIKQETH